MGIPSDKIEEVSKINIGSSLSSVDDSLKSQIYWAYINENLISISKFQDKNILYTAPSFVLNGKIVGLSQFFYVKLKKTEDLELLQIIAQENRVSILGQVKNMPEWYILSCSKDSNGNALEMANKFYERELFETLRLCGNG